MVKYKKYQVEFTIKYSEKYLMMKYGKLKDYV
jgi:hypothetical protein